MSEDEQPFLEIDPAVVEGYPAWAVIAELVQAQLEQLGYQWVINLVPNAHGLCSVALYGRGEHWRYGVQPARVPWAILSAAVEARTADPETRPFAR